MNENVELLNYKRQLLHLNCTLITVQHENK